MRYLSLCSGMEAASVAWKPLGWKPGAFSEIELACCDLLEVRHPDVPNLGDMTADDFIDRAKKYGPYDLVCGGTPCQSFSIAGLREGLNDERGNLTLRFVEICNGVDPDWIVWENVRDVLSDETNAFGCFLAGLVGEAAPLVAPGGKWTDAGYVAGPKRTIAWRVLDAQYFQLAQRRRRVFVVGVRAGIGIHPGQVLFEPESVRRHTPPSREKGQGTTHDIASSIGASGRGFSRAGETRGQDPVVACPLTKSPLTSKDNVSNPKPGDPCHPLAKGAHPPAVAFNHRQDPVSQKDLAFAQEGRQSQGVMAFMPGQGARAGSVAASGKLSPTLKGAESGTNRVPGVVAGGMAVRRLTPRECERLQGFPDDYSLVPRLQKTPIEEDEYICECGEVFWSDDSDINIECPRCGNTYNYSVVNGETGEPHISLTGKRRRRKRPNGKPMADSPRYKMLGNSWATTVVRWIGERIEKANALLS